MARWPGRSSTPPVLITRCYFIHFVNSETTLSSKKPPPKPPLDTISNLVRCVHTFFSFPQAGKAPRSCCAPGGLVRTPSGLGFGGPRPCPSHSYPPPSCAAPVHFAHSVHSGPALATSSAPTGWLRGERAHFQPQTVEAITGSKRSVRKARCSTLEVLLTMKVGRTK